MDNYTCLIEIVKLSRKYKISRSYVSQCYFKYFGANNFLEGENSGEKCVGQGKECFRLFILQAFLQFYENS